MNKYDVYLNGIILCTCYSEEFAEEVKEMIQSKTSEHAKIHIEKRK